MIKKQKEQKTKQRLLDAAQDFMLTKGYGATSIDEICKAAKVTKGCFFHYFKSKEDLGRILLGRFCCSTNDKIQASCCPQKIGQDPLRRVYSYVDHAIQLAKSSSMKKGCLLGTLSQELSDTHPKFREMCSEGFDEWAKGFKKDLIAAKAKYVPKKDFKPESLADYFIAILEGSQLLAKVKQNQKLVEQNLIHFRNYLKTLFNK